MLLRKVFFPFREMVFHFNDLIINVLMQHRLFIINQIKFYTDTKTEKNIGKEREKSLLSF